MTFLPKFDDFLIVLPSRFFFAYIYILLQPGSSFEPKILEKQLLRKMYADYFMNVRMATIWEEPIQLMENVVHNGFFECGKEIPWEITFSNANNVYETFVLMPTPESVLEIGMLCMGKRDESFEPRNYSHVRYFFLHYTQIEQFVRCLASGISFPDILSSSIIQSWKLPEKVIGVVNEESLVFLQRYFGNIVKISMNPIDIPNIPEGFESDEFVADFLKELEEPKKSEVTMRRSNRLLARNRNKTL